jgi:serine/threonine protein phosphatase PrpC
MNETKQYIDAFFAQNKIIVPEKNKINFDLFLGEENIIAAVKAIKENQKLIMDKYTIINRVFEINNKQINLPNATENIAYAYSLDFIKLGIVDIIYIEFDGLANFGLDYNPDTKTIEGIPTNSGDVKAVMKYRIEIEAETSKLNEKIISFYINNDPKSLWKSIDSDTTDSFWKEDNVAIYDKIGLEKNIVIASKRGRSHANVGSFRDDDFAYGYNQDTGWSAVSVSDGAGSYKYSRKGSMIACQEVLDYLAHGFSSEYSAQLEELIRKYKSLDTTISDSVILEKAEEIKLEKSNESTEDTMESTGVLEIETKEMVYKQIQGFLYKTLGNAVFQIHKKIETFATENNHTIKDYGSTLIFTLFKKFDFGYCILSFGVGDCPIAVINKDQTNATLLNWLDVGEFGGGTRFVTEPEIFTKQNFITRFNFKLIDDFSYLMLMTDGIYDPKFVVEANLEKLEKWNEFIDDLKGNNDDKLAVVFDEKNQDIATQLSKWMDFWSAGNHDDRTLAIVY